MSEVKITKNQDKKELIKITINGAATNVEKGTSLSDLLKQIEPVDPSEKKYLVVSSKKAKNFVEGYTLNTNLGRILVDLDKDLDNFKIEDVKLSWTTADKVVFGPISLEGYDEKSLVSKEVKRNANDIFLLHGESESYLGFSITNHKDTSLIPEGAENDTIGKVTAGATLLRKFGKDDFIKDVEVKYETKSSIEKLKLDTTLMEGMELYSHVNIELDRLSPDSVEAFLTYMDGCDSILTIEDTTNAYVRIENPLPFKIPIENNRPQRKSGYVFVRNSGFRKNSIYIYRSDFMRLVHQNNIGKITNGLDLIKVARTGENVLIRTDPQRIFVVGMTQSKAQEVLGELGITQERSGDIEADSVIVSQSPSITMGITDNCHHGDTLQRSYTYKIFRK